MTVSCLLFWDFYLCRVYLRILSHRMTKNWGETFSLNRQVLCNAICCANCIWSSFFSWVLNIRTVNTLPRVWVAEFHSTSLIEISSYTEVQQRGLIDLLRITEAVLPRAGIKPFWCQICIISSWWFFLATKQVCWFYLLMGILLCPGFAGGLTTKEWVETGLRVAQLLFCGGLFLHSQWKGSVLAALCLLVDSFSTVIQHWFLLTNVNIYLYQRNCK